MGINFPNNPSQGALYTPPGGYQYVFLDGVWRVVESPQSVGTAQARNRIVNGAMQISQEYGMSGTPSGGYAADQWQTVFNVANVASSRDYGPTPNGSAYTFYLGASASTAIAAGSLVCFYQSIEGLRVADFQWGTASAKQVVLRFWFKAPAGTYSASALNVADNYDWIGMFTVTAGQANTWTQQNFVIPGPTAGTWPIDNTRSVTVQISLAAGSTWHGVAGWNASASKYATSAITAPLAAGSYYLADVGLYLDPNATGTPPPWQMPDEAQELMACQRYYEVGLVQLVNTGAIPEWSHMATMRIAPAFTVAPSAGSGGVLYASASNTRFTQAAYNSAVATGSTFQANARM